MAIDIHAQKWWERSDLHYGQGQLQFGSHSVFALAQAYGTPLYLYHVERIKQNFLRLQGTLTSRSLNARVFYAMKSNRHPGILTLLHSLGLCGIDSCSPQEMLLALECGFREDQISYTGTALAPRDWSALAQHPNVWINCDSLSAIKRVGETQPGREIGIRINPAMGAGYESNELLRYSGQKATKFGIYRDRFPEALSLARTYGLRVTGLHFHTGCGYLTPQLPLWEEIIRECLWFLDQTPEVTHVNVGGGLGIPLVESDRPLDLDLWGDILRRTLGDRGVQIWVEPGDYLVKDAGVLALQVTMVEEKAGTLFVGVDGGFNIHIEPAFYHLPLEPVPCVQPSGQAQQRLVTIAGNINEALDIWSEDIFMPEIAEGDYLAFLNAGGYGAAMSSNHCLRGQFSEVLI